MCGICGFYIDRKSSHHELSERLMTMTTSLTHRGPDNFGVWNDDTSGIYLGHRRLSIIDLSEAGKQPMHSQNDRFVITFNGEIYNFKNIRTDLEKNKGIKFTNQTDTQVLLEACSVYGIEKTLKLLEGMFAFALWDKQKKTLYLARDRVGKKPLYWGYVGNNVVFASELKAINKFPGFTKSLNYKSISSFLQYGYINAPDSIYENINKVEPGGLIRINENKEVHVSKFWSLDNVITDGEQKSGSKQEIHEGLESLLKDSVRKRMISDVPLGVMLSGGIDSTLVTALMQTESSQPVKSYCIGFNDKQYDESVHAKKIAEYLGTDHHEFHAEADSAIELLPSLPNIYDEPFGDASQIPTLIVSKLLKSEVSVALSGDGGDEVFAGYSRYFWGEKISAFNKTVPYLIRNLMSKLIHSVPPHKLDMMFSLLPDKLTPAHSGERLHKIANILKVNSDSELYSKLVSQWTSPKILLPEIQDQIIDLETYPGDYDIISAMQYLDTNSYLPGDILVKVDRASMANSLEVRSPLLDHRIIEYAWGLDRKYKINNGKGKHILREILYQYVPQKLVDRPKMGFGVPISEWLRGPLKEWAYSLLNEERIIQQGIFEPKPIKIAFDAHMKRERNYQYPLWMMLMFQSWYEQWIV